MFYETIFYILLLAVLTCYIVELQSGAVYDCRQQQMRYWGGCDAEGRCTIDDVKDAKTLMDWMGESLVPLAFTDKPVYAPISGAASIYELNEDSITWSPRFAGDTKTNILLGNVRIRQNRVIAGRNCQ